MKFCKDCKHYIGSNYCISPKNGINMVNGTNKNRFASESREHNAPSDFMYCGIDAKFFESKIEPN